MEPPLSPCIEVLLLFASAPTHRIFCAGAQRPVQMGHTPVLPAFRLPVCICSLSLSLH